MRDKWQRSMGHVLVDEYQDTNATQYEVLKLLVGARGRFTAVGDDDQSIYGWRGATLDNLRKLPVDYPTLKVVKLEQNYRSTSAILRAANNVIGPNPKLFPKTLFSELGEGEPVRVVDCDSEEHEAERVVARIQSLRAGAEMQAVGGASPSQRYAALVERFGAPAYARIDAPATREEKALLARLSPQQVTATELAGDPITATLTEAPGNAAAIGGLKVTTGSGWFAARPSGTEDVYKIYAESFRGAEHLALLQAEAQELVASALRG